DPVRDRGARLGLAVFVAGVIPVVILAALDVAGEIIEIVGRGRAAGGVVIGPAAVAPIGELHVVVDADEVYVGVAPQRIEIEQQRAGRVAGLVRVVFRPVRRIAELGLGQEDAHVGGQVLQRAYRGIVVRAAAQACQPDEFR